jgi:hypothetical protein
MENAGSGRRSGLGKEELLRQIDDAIARIDQLPQKSPKAQLADELLRAARASVAERNAADDT